MKRRGFIASLGIAALGWPIGAWAQGKKIPRVGVLWHAGSEEEEAIPLGDLRQGFRHLGYIEGTTLILENRFPAEQYDRFQALANELVDLNVDVLVAATRLAALAAQRATTTIPIVFVVVPDPVGNKLVASLARPGGNITGLTNMAIDLTAKRMELLQRALPDIRRVAALLNPRDPEIARLTLSEFQAAADGLGLMLHTFEVRQPGELDYAFTSMAEQKMDGVVNQVDPMFYNECKRIAELGYLHRLPIIGHVDKMAESGTLLSYGPDYHVMLRRTAQFVDKILKGTRPSEIPVELPAKFEMVINLKTAKALGVTLSSMILAAADRVID